MKTMKDVRKAFQERQVAKRNGTYVSRPLLNAQEWHDWAQRAGVPGLLAPEDMHVTICYSPIDVKVPLVTTPMMVSTTGGYYEPGAFAMFGPESESFVFAFSSWQLQDENWTLQAAGAVSDWPTYRPHLTLSNAAKDFDLPDTALADVPAYIVLGAQTVAPIATVDPSDQDQGVDDEDDAGGEDGAIVIVIQASAQAAAAKALERTDLGVMDRAGLYDVAKGRRVTKAVARSIAKRAWASPELKALTSDSAAPPAPAPAAQPVTAVKTKRVEEREVQMTLKPLEGAAAERYALKSLDEEHRTAIGWASVSTINGEYVQDLQGDTITVHAQKQWLEDLIKGQRQALVEHEGDVVGEVVQGIVMDKSLQDALGIDLGVEGVITVTHYTDDATWAMVKSGKWMHSIAGLMLVEVEE